MRLPTRLKKGETLVEVIVSFSLISIVVMGVASVTSDVMSLAVNARNQTEAVLLAQKNLVIAKNILQTSCSADNTDNYLNIQKKACLYDVIAPLGDKLDEPEFDGVVYHRCYTDYSAFSTEDQDNYLPAIYRSGIVYISGLNNGTGETIDEQSTSSLTPLKTDMGFYKLTSKVIWVERGKRWDYNISEIIKR